MVSSCASHQKWPKVKNGFSPAKPLQAPSHPHSTPHHHCLPGEHNVCLVSTQFCIFSWCATVNASQHIYYNEFKEECFRQSLSLFWRKKIISGILGVIVIILHDTGSSRLPRPKRAFLQSLWGRCLHSTRGWHCLPILRGFLFKISRIYIETQFNLLGV